MHLPIIRIEKKIEYNLNSYLSIQTYLQSIVDSPVLRKDESVRAILQLRERNFTSKYQTLTGLKYRLRATYVHYNLSLSDFL